MGPLAQIALVDCGGTDLDPTALEAWAVAYQIQINTQFALPPPIGWGIGVEYVRTAKSAADLKPDEWPMFFQAKPDQPGALGDHDKTQNGKPIMRIFPLLDAQDGKSASQTGDHELVETLVDPELTLAFQAVDGTFWAGETADAVEEDSYLVSGVTLSNWCTPLWFSPPDDPAGARFDFLGLCTRDHEIRAGGYGQTWGSHGWQEILSQMGHPRAYRTAVRRSSRRSRRARMHQKAA